MTIGAGSTLLAVADSATTTENSSITIAELSNDTIPYSDSISVGISTQPANGSAAVVGSNIVYTPSTGFYGTDQFTYTLSDSYGHSSTAVDTIVVQGGSISVTGTGLVGIAGQTMTNAEVASFTDSNALTVSELAATILWGDGQESFGDVVSVSPGSYDVVASHIFSLQGPYIYAVEVTDSTVAAGAGVGVIDILQANNLTTFETVGASVSSSNAVTQSGTDADGSFSLTDTGSLSYTLTESGVDQAQNFSTTQVGSLSLTLVASGTDTIGTFDLNSSSITGTGADSTTSYYTLITADNPTSSSLTSTDTSKLAGLGTAALGGLSSWSDTLTGSDTSVTSQTTSTGSFNATQTDAGTETLAYTGTPSTGAYSLADTKNSSLSAIVTMGTDGAVSYTDTQTGTDGFSLTNTGDLWSGSFTLDGRQ